MLIEQTKCQICDSTEWVNLDYLRDQTYWYRKDFREADEPVGFKVCKTCGFLTYDYIDEDRLSQSYDRQRMIMNPANIITCNRKNEYHKKLLLPLIKQTDKVLDIGCAQGSLLNLIYRASFGIPKENLYGTEHSKSYANFARYEYGLENITDEINFDIKYNVIILYHVFEHIQGPDAFLKKIKDILIDDGALYISVPHYLDRLEDSTGLYIDSYEEMYHLNHVNVFSLQAITNIFNKNGLDIEYFDDKMYGWTFILRKSKEQKEIVLEDYKVVIETLERQKKAIDFMATKQFEKAIETEPSFIDAYVYLALNRENMKSFEAQDAIFKKALEVCPDNLKILNQVARLYYQFDENNPEKQYYSNNIKKSEELFEKIKNEKPGNEDAYYFLGLINLKYKKDYKKAVECFKKFLEMNPSKFNETWTLLAHVYNQMGKA